MSEYWKPDIERYVKRMAWIGSIFVWVIVGIIIRFEDAIAALQKDDPSRLLIYWRFCINFGCNWLYKRWCGEEEQDKPLLVTTASAKATYSLANSNRSGHYRCVSKHSVM